MRKQLPEIPELTEEEIATEMIELTCDEMDALTRAFNMLTTLCENLSREVQEEGAAEVPENLVN